MERACSDEPGFTTPHAFSASAEIPPSEVPWLRSETEELGPD